MDRIFNFKHNQKMDIVATFLLLNTSIAFLIIGYLSPIETQLVWYIVGSIMGMLALIPLCMFLNDPRQYRVLKVTREDEDFYKVQYKGYLKWVDIKGTDNKTLTFNDLESAKKYAIQQSVKLAKDLKLKKKDKVQELYKTKFNGQKNDQTASVPPVAVAQQQNEQTTQQQTNKHTLKFDKKASTEQDINDMLNALEDMPVTDDEEEDNEQQEAESETEENSEDANVATSDANVATSKDNVATSETKPETKPKQETANDDESKPVQSSTKKGKKNVLAQSIKNSNIVAASSADDINASLQELKKEWRDKNDDTDDDDDKSAFHENLSQRFLDVLSESNTDNERETKQSNKKPKNANINLHKNPAQQAENSNRKTGNQKPMKNQNPSQQNANDADSPKDNEDTEETKEGWIVPKQKPSQASVQSGAVSQQQSPAQSVEQKASQQATVEPSQNDQTAVPPATASQQQNGQGAQQSKAAQPLAPNDSDNNGGQQPAQTAQAAQNKTQEKSDSGSPTPDNDMDDSSSSASDKALEQTSQADQTADKGQNGAEDDSPIIDEEDAIRQYAEENQRNQENQKVEFSHASDGLREETIKMTTTSQKYDGHTLVIAENMENDNSQNVIEPDENGEIHVEVDENLNPHFSNSNSHKHG